MPRGCLVSTRTLPGLAGLSPGALQFCVYEELKNLYNYLLGQEPINTKCGTPEYFTYAAVSNLVAALAT